MLRWLFFSARFILLPTTHVTNSYSFKPILTSRRK